MEQLPLCKCCLLLPFGRASGTHTLSVTHQSLGAPHPVLFIFLLFFCCMIMSFSPLFFSFSPYFSSFLTSALSDLIHKNSLFKPPIHFQLLFLPCPLFLLPVSLSLCLLCSFVLHYVSISALSASLSLCLPASLPAFFLAIRPFFQQ